MRIAIDAMGGDHAPKMIVEGAVRAALEWTDAEIILVGDSVQIDPLLMKKPANLHVHHASETILASDEPVKAIRRKKDASMVVACRLVSEGAVDALISAGNTGALMAAGMLIIGRIEGVERPALAPMFPTLDGIGVLALDMGANMDATADQLLQYAIMGSLYRSRIDGISKPRVGLLNVGTEEMKGNELTKAAFALLSQSPIHFIGNVEARDLLQGTCDVVVCDGFVGNIMLKSFEGAEKVIFSSLKKEFTKSLITKLAAAILKSGIMKFKKQMDYTEHGGALLLGINGICLKSHGSSDANAIKNAVRQARNAVKSELIRSISAEISGSGR